MDESTSGYLPKSKDYRGIKVYLKQKGVSYPYQFESALDSFFDAGDFRRGDGDGTGGEDSQVDFYIRESH